MSKNLKYKQVANVTRRTWDAETYEKKAQARTQALESGSKKDGPQTSGSSGLGDKQPADGDEDDRKEEFTHAAPGAAGPYKSQRAFLKARRDKVDVDSKVGSVEFVSPEAISTTSTKLDDGVSIKVSLS
jgi:hypothetical protein